MAFVYCNLKEYRTTTTYMRLALKELCQAMQSLPPELQEVYQRNYRNDSQSNYDDLRTVFRAIIQQVGCIFFVVDALDECPLDQRSELCEFLLNIANLTSNQETIKLFITSRKEPEIEQAFRKISIPIIEIEVAKVHSDIAIYTKAQIEQRLQDGRLVLKNLALKEKILSALTTKAGGTCVFL